MLRLERRVIGDTIFAAGVVAIVVIVFGVITGHSTQPEKSGLVAARISEMA
jgi:hypothetical protein